jgi:hypothetical protein
MFFNEHGLPHFHAVDGEYKITVEIESGTVRGAFPPRALRLVLEWAQLHKPNCWTTGSGRAGGSRSSASRHWSSHGLRRHRSTVRRPVCDLAAIRDNTSGEIDLEKELYGPVFEPLRDTAVFRQFQVHPEFHTLTWPNGADFAPEFLHDNVRVTA